MNNTSAQQPVVRRIIQAVLAMTVFVGLLGAPTALDRTPVAAPVPSGATTPGTAQTTALVLGGNAATAPAAASAASSVVSGSSVTQPQAGAAARAFIEGVKRYGGQAYNAMVQAVRSGYNAFVRWFNTLPGWVKALAGGLSVNTLYDIIKGILGF